MQRDNMLPADRGHIDSLDGLRAIAAFVVLTFHVAYITGELSTGSGGWRAVAHGDVGVPIFFTLSGLLLYRPWARRAFALGPAPRIRTYLWRRALRILPAYWVVVIVALPAFNGSHAASPTVWVEWLTMTHIYDLHPWWRGTGPAGLGQMWSLSTEVAFYLLLPIIAGVLGWYARHGGADTNTRARRLLTVLGVLGLGSLVWSALVHDTAYSFYYELWLPRSIGWFAAGMALTVLAEWSRAETGSPYGPVGRFCRTLAHMPGVCWLIAAAAWGLVATPLGGPAFLEGSPSVFQSEARTVLYLIIAAGLVAPAAFQSEGQTLTTAALGSPLMRFLGKISYGVFLWQFVILYTWYDTTDRPFFNHDFWLVLPVAMAGTIAAATVCYRVIEEPAQRLKTASPRWAVTLPAQAQRPELPESSGPSASPVEPANPPPPAQSPTAQPLPSATAPAVDTRTGRWQRGR